MPHNKSKYWDKGFWVWQGDRFWFFSNIYLPHSYFFICVYIKKNTSHMSQQPINAVDTGNLSLHIPHALGSGGEQPLPVTKGHFRTFASIPRSFLAHIRYCEEGSQGCLPLGTVPEGNLRAFWRCILLVLRSATKRCVVWWAEAQLTCYEDFKLWVFDEICYRNVLMTMSEGPE